MRDFKTNEIVGLTIWGFGEKHENNTLPAWPEGLEVNTESDIIPHIELGRAVPSEMGIH
jgi:hypothetical protein